MKLTVRKFKETVEINSSTLNKLKSHRYFPISVLFCLFLVVACFHVWQRVRVVTLVKEISILKNDSGELLDNKKKLYSELVSLSTLSRIERYAVDTLGLKPIEAERLLTLLREDIVPVQPDELRQMMTAVKRIVEFLPVIEETRAKAGAVEDITIDSTINGWGEK